MDPITMAIVGALADLSATVVKDAYEALKAALAEKCGVDSEVDKAVKKLEEKPGSPARKGVLQEEIKSAGVDQDKHLMDLAGALLEAIEHQQQGQSTLNINQKAGDNAVQIGEVKGNVDIKR